VTVPTLLVVDSDQVIADVLRQSLEEPGRTVLAATDVEVALDLVRGRGPVDVALVDRNAGGGRGLALARDVRILSPGSEVILLTGYASFESAVEALQAGVFDYLAKPIDDFDALRLRVANAFERVAARRERAALQARLAESEARHRQLFEGAPDAILAFDPATGLVREANPAAARLLGVERPALVGMPAAALFADPPALFAIPPTLDASGGAPAAPEAAECTTPAGRRFPVEVTGGTVEVGGRPLVLLTLRDVTERERLLEERRTAEAALRHSQKMEAVGRLAGGIGHDLGNILAVVNSCLSELRELAGEAPHEALLQAADATDRAVRLVRQLLTLSRKGTVEPAILQLDRVADDLARLARKSLGAQVAIASEHPADLWPVLADGSQLGQVVLNLIVNARDAMPEGGRLGLTTRNLPASGRSPGGGLPPGDYVQLAVSDTGHGMTPELLERIFEPFYTTKAPGKGTGLGLSISHGIVEQAGGAILVESAPGEGATFRVVLPRAGRAPAPEAQASPEVPTALVVDDAEEVRRLMARALRQAGYHVVEAASAEEALAAEAGAVALLVTDAVMTGLGGVSLIDAIRRLHPACRALLVTGNATDPEVLAFASRGGEVLEKPFTVAELLDRVKAPR
jgi:PAS domain S-box-containing protein